MKGIFTLADLLIVVATPMEIAPFLALCTVGDHRKTPGGTSVITARFKAMTFKVIVTGPGMVNTAMALGSHLAYHRPRLIIQTGIAGFFKGTGLCMGGIGIATAEIDIHCGVEKAAEGAHGLYPLPFSLTGSPMEGRDGQVAMHPGLVRTARTVITDAFSSHHPLPGRWKAAPPASHAIPFSSAHSAPGTNILNNGTSNGVNLASHHPLPAPPSGRPCHPRACPVVSGPFITVSTLTALPETVTRLAQAHTPVMEAMEGMAAAQVACRYEVPFLEIRSGSNPVGIRDRNAWDIPLAVGQLSMALAALFDKGGALCTQIPPPKRN